MADVPDEMMGLINPEEKPVEDPPKEEKHCFPYYDFALSLGRRFDGSFLFILIV